MKKNFKVWMAAAAVTAMMITGCSKEEIPSVQSPASSELSIPEIDVLVNQTDEEFSAPELNGGTENEVFSSEYDGIPDAYQVDESTADNLSSNSVSGHATGKRMRKCLSGLKLSNDQIAKLKRLFVSYHDCKSGIVKRHALAMRSLIAKYNEKHDMLVKALRNGRITKAEFEKHVKALRIEFKRSANQLAKSSRMALRNCYSKMLRGLHSILNERQWKAFVNCYRR